MNSEQQAIAAQWPSVNALAAPLVEALTRDARVLRLGIDRLSNGATIIDAGIERRGGVEAGRRIAEICMGTVGQVSIVSGSPFEPWPWQVCVTTGNPVLACLGSQYAGWSLSHGEGKGAYRAMGSGPGRAAAGKEALFDELCYHDRAQAVCLVLETDQVPPVELAEKVARACNVPVEKVTFILTPTTSLAGAVQVVGRVLEVGLHKAHALGFPLHQIVDGMGAAPLCPPSANFLSAMGRTNDAILFGGQLQLFVDCGPGDAEQLASQLPSNTSKDYGKPFGEIFKAVNYDFYQIDPHLFAPAVAMVTEIKSGKTFRAGAFNAQLLEQSFA
ncbi:MAG: methenyltetrahydromethanopterin cyclohydrolase [Burkholderiales bacterium]